MGWATSHSLAIHLLGGFRNREGVTVDELFPVVMISGMEYNVICDDVKYGT